MVMVIYLDDFSLVGCLGSFNYFFQKGKQTVPPWTQVILKAGIYIWTVLPITSSNQFCDRNSLKIPASYLPSQVQRYWTINLWPDKRWQCPYYLHMTLRSPENAVISCDTAPKMWVWFRERKKTLINVEMNRVFWSPLKFNLYSHYTQFPQQYSVSLSMSCILHVLTQILHELKWRQANTILQNGTFGETAVRRQLLQSFSFHFSCQFTIYWSHTQ